MITFTRRDALMLTAAAAATTSVPQASSAADPNPDPAQIDVPLDVVGGSSIPIAIKIPQDKYDPKKYPTVKLAVQIKPAKDDPLSALGAGPFPVFEATFKNDAIGKDGLSLMARLKIPSREYLSGQQPGANSPAQFKVVVIATTTLFDGANPPASPPPFATPDPDKLPTITVKKEECATVDIAVMRLALKPREQLKVNEQLTVKAVVPASSRTLQAIDCQKSNGVANPFKLDVKNAKLLSDEVFVGFNLYPDKAGDDLLTMTWTYEVPPPAPVPAAPAPAAPVAAPPAPAAAQPAPAPAPNNKVIASALFHVDASSS